MVGELTEVLDKKLFSILEEILEEEPLDDDNETQVTSEEVTAMLEKLPYQPLSQFAGEEIDANFFNLSEEHAERKEEVFTEEEGPLSLTQELEESGVKVSPGAELTDFDESFKACRVIFPNGKLSEACRIIFGRILVRNFFWAQFKTSSNNKRKRGESSSGENPLKKRLINFKGFDIDAESPLKIISKLKDKIKLELGGKLSVDISVNASETSLSYEILQPTSKKDPYHLPIAELLANPLKSLPEMKTDVDLNIFLQQLQDHAKWVQRFQRNELRFLIDSSLCHIPISAKPISSHLSNNWKLKAEHYLGLGDVIFLVIVADPSRKKLDGTAVALMVGVTNSKVGFNTECVGVFNGYGKITKQIAEEKIQTEKTLEKLIPSLRAAFPKQEDVEKYVAKDLADLQSLLQKR